jgi:hypothetical protein
MLHNKPVRTDQQSRQVSAHDVGSEITIQSEDQDEESASNHIVILFIRLWWR